MDNYSHNKNKDWWRDLKVGDLVCDCRYKHLKISVIIREYIDRYSFNFYIYTPSWFPDWLDDLLWSVQARLPKKSIWCDSTLILEDNSRCSAIHCCDPCNHEWEHPEK